MLEQQVSSLLLYSSVWEDEVGQAFLSVLNVLQQPEPDLSQVLWAYGQLFKALSTTQHSWPDYLLKRMSDSDNPFTLQVQHYPLEQLPAELLEAVRYDLGVLQHLWQWNPEDLTQAIGHLGDLPCHRYPALLKQILLRPCHFYKSTIIGLRPCLR